MSWTPILWIVLAVVLVVVVVIVVTTALVLDQQDNGTTSASTDADTNPDGTDNDNNDTATNPTALPTQSPSWTPSSVPTQSLLPSVVPTTSLVPSTSPSSNPTQALGLDITMTNYLTGCVASTLNGVCTEPPSLTGFLFRGGDCAIKNFTSQPIQDYTCTDFPQKVGMYGGITSLGSGESAHIVANADPGDAPGGSAGNALPPLFQGIVQEDSLYFLFNNRQPLPNRTQIRVWPANATVRDASTLLQEVRFDSSCANSLYILNVFGAHQVVFFQMPGQATAVSVYVATPICRMTIQVFVEAWGEQAVTIANASALANFATPKATLISEWTQGQTLCPPHVAAEAANGKTPTVVCNTTRLEWDLVVDNPFVYEAFLLMIMVGAEQVVEDDSNTPRPRVMAWKPLNDEFP